MASNSKRLSVTYRFERDMSSPVGVMSAQRASTDAMTVVASWELRAEGHSFDVLVDEDAYLVVHLRLEEADAEAAREDLHRLCVENGIRREALE